MTKTKIWKTLTTAGAFTTPILYPTAKDPPIVVENPARTNIFVQPFEGTCENK